MSGIISGTDIGLVDHDFRYFYINDFFMKTVDENRKAVLDNISRLGKPFSECWSRRDVAMRLIDSYSQEGSIIDLMSGDGIMGLGIAYANQGNLEERSIVCVDSDDISVDESGQSDGRVQNMFRKHKNAFFGNEQSNVSFAPYSTSQLVGDYGADLKDDPDYPTFVSLSDTGISLLPENEKFGLAVFMDCYDPEQSPEQEGMAIAGMLSDKVLVIDNHRLDKAREYASHYFRHVSEPVRLDIIISDTCKYHLDYFLAERFVLS